MVETINKPEAGLQKRHPPCKGTENSKKPANHPQPWSRDAAPKKIREYGARNWKPWGRQAIRKFQLSGTIESVARFEMKNGDPPGLEMFKNGLWPSTGEKMLWRSYEKLQHEATGS